MSDTDNSAESTFTEVNSFTLAHRKYQHDEHQRLQLLVLKVAVIVCMPAYVAIIIADPCWQNLAQLLGFSAMAATWWYGYRLTKQGETVLSIALFTYSNIIFQFIILLSFADALVTAVMGQLGSVIYASYFSRRLVMRGLAASFVSVVIGEALRIGNFYEMKVFTPFERLAFIAFFGGIILVIIALVLRRSKDIIENLLETMKGIDDKKSGIIDAANDINHVLEEAVKQIKEVSEAFASQANDQSSAINEINNAMVQVRHIAAETADAAMETRSVSEAIREKSLRTSRRLQSVEEGFDRVVEINEVAQAEFDDLASQAESIEDILRSNREIAGQIKILAVNAGIQAAKAGMYGSGFRVVANELKGLISRTDESLTHSRQLLEDIRTRARQSAGTIMRSSDLLRHQFEELNSTGSTIEEITQSFGETTVGVDKISKAAKEQQSRLDEVGNGIDYIDFAAAELTNSTEVLVKNVNRIVESHRNLKSVLDQHQT